MRIKQASITAALLAVLWILGNPALAEASVPSTLGSSRVLKTADPFATAPQLDLPPLAQQLRVVEERRAAVAECVPLCELAAGIDAHPFGVAAADPPNRSEDAWGNYRFGSELTASKNPFGYTGHYWDKEASLYYAKARFYDPFTARFTQADSFLGSIDDPPSLHRYAYAADNPTFYVDPTGHIVRQVVDESINRDTNNSGWFGAGLRAFFKEASYQTGDLISFGALHRQDKLVDQNLAGQINDEQYYQRTALNVSLSATQAALTLGSGGTASTAVRAFGQGAGLGVLGQGVSDAGEVLLTHTKDAADVRASDYFKAAAFGGLGGVLGFKAETQAAQRAAGRTTIQEPSAPVPGYASHGGEFADDALRMKEQPFTQNTDAGYIGPERQLSAPRVRGRANPIGEQGPFYVDRRGAASTELLPQAQINRVQGNALRDQYAEHFRNLGYEVETEVFKRTPFGRRFIDIELSLDGKVLGGLEMKRGGSRYGSRQRAKDMYLKLTQKYQVHPLREP